MPIFALIGIVLIGLIGFIVATGEEPATLLPLFAAGVPAIVAGVRM